MVSRQDLASLKNINTYVVFLRWFGACLGYSWLAWKTWTPESVFAIGLGRFFGISLVFLLLSFVMLRWRLACPKKIRYAFLFSWRGPGLWRFWLAREIRAFMCAFPADSCQIVGASGKFGH